MRTRYRRKSGNSRISTFSISWKDAAGITRTADVQAVKGSSSGLAFNSVTELPLETTVHIASNEASNARCGVVRHCNWNGKGHTITVELDHDTEPNSDTDLENYYEFLQISPNAQPGTIHRVYRYLAGMYHPDNPESGDAERFLTLNRAYRVLSDPEKRAHYDAELNLTCSGPSPAFAGVDFMDGVEGELNRRLAVLSVLYKKCRSNIHDARVTLVQLEAQMGFPREYLDFTTWYLRSKKYISREDNSDFALTASGVDFIEENYSKIPLLKRLLSAGMNSQSRKPSGENGFVSPLIPEASISLAFRSDPTEGQSRRHDDVPCEIEVSTENAEEFDGRATS